jgi:hypothetical protein
MIAKMSLLPVAFMSLVACGGDDGGGVHLVDAKVADAKVFMDAKACLTPATIGNGSVGTAAMPATGQFFVKPMTGEVEYLVKIGLNSDALKDFLYLAVPKPTGGTWATNTPYMFETDATATGTPAAIAFIDADAPAMGDGLMTLWPENGSITFTMLGTNNGDKVNATVSMTSFKEIDADGNQVVGGCATALAGLSIFGQQNADAPARIATPSGPGADTTTATARALDIRDLPTEITINWQ